MADVSLCRLPFLPFSSRAGPLHSFLNTVTLRHPEALRNGFSSISLLIRIITAFSFRTPSQFIYSLLPLFFPCTVQYVLHLLSGVIMPHSHFEMQRCPHHLFVSESSLDRNICTIFLLATCVGDHQVKLGNVRPTNVHSPHGSFFLPRLSTPAPSHQRRRIWTRGPETSCREH